MTIKHFTAANVRAADLTEIQSDKYLTNNDQADVIMDRMVRKKTIPIGISSGNTIFLGEADFGENFLFRFVDEPGSPTLDGPWVLQVPETIISKFGVMNDTSFTMFVESGGSPGDQVEVPVGGRADLHHDGEAIVETKRDVYDLIMFTNVVTEGAIIGAVLPPRTIRLPDGLPGSRAYAFTQLGAGEDDVVLSIQVDESEIGTVTFTALDSDGVFALSGDQDIINTERLRFIWSAFESPSTAMSMADVAITIKGINL